MEQSTLTDSMPQREPGRLREVASSLTLVGQSVDGAWQSGASSRPRQEVSEVGDDARSIWWTTWRP